MYSIYVDCLGLLVLMDRKRLVEESFFSLEIDSDYIMCFLIIYGFKHTGWVKCNGIRIASIRTCWFRREGSSLESTVRSEEADFSVLVLLIKWLLLAVCEINQSCFWCRLEHVDELLRSARMSGYLYIRTVTTIFLSTIQLHNFKLCLVNVNLGLWCFDLCFVFSDGSLYLENLLLSTILKLMTGFPGLLCFMVLVFFSTSNQQVFDFHSSV